MNISAGDNSVFFNTEKVLVRHFSCAILNIKMQKKTKTAPRVPYGCQNSSSCNQEKIGL